MLQKLFWGDGEQLAGRGHHGGRLRMWNLPEMAVALTKRFKKRPRTLEISLHSLLQHHLLALVTVRDCIDRLQEDTLQAKRLCPCGCCTKLLLCHQTVCAESSCCGMDSISNSRD